MEINHQKKNRKLHGSLLIGMLILFVVVYQRHNIDRWRTPKSQIADNTPNAKRAANPWNKKHADSAITIVKDGDLVLRSGNDAISEFFKKANTKDRTFSHAGIVFIENGYPFVYNCIGNADDPEALLKRDSLNAYISPYNNIGYAVYRYKLNAAQLSKLQATSVRYFKEKRRFDPHFDLSTDTLLYCTEFVYKAVIEATGDKEYLPITKATNFSYVSVDNLFLRKDAKLVCKIGYIH